MTQSRRTPARSRRASADPAASPGPEVAALTATLAVQRAAVSNPPPFAPPARAARELEPTGRDARQRISI
jgi:hypothetical protein